MLTWVHALRPPPNAACNLESAKMEPIWIDKGSLVQFRKVQTTKGSKKCEPAMLISYLTFAINTTKLLHKITAEKLLLSYHVHHFLIVHALSSQVCFLEYVELYSNWDTAIVYLSLKPPWLLSLIWAQALQPCFPITLRRRFCMVFRAD